MDTHSTLRCLKDEGTGANTNYLLYYCDPSYVGLHVALIANDLLSLALHLAQCGRHVISKVVFPKFQLERAPCV
jgi:hypothetical protein